MKRLSIGNGVYTENGKFWVRPWVGGKRTWRKLDAIKQKFAIEEARAKFTDHARAKHGTGKSPFLRDDSPKFKEVAALYAAANCPNRRLESRPGRFSELEKIRVVNLVQFFGEYPASAVKIQLLPKYSEWRRKQIPNKKFNGDRTVDLDFSTLSNVLTYGVAIGQLEYNPISAGRPRYRTKDKIKHSRERMIEGGDAVHRLADYFFDRPQSEVMGWLVIFSALTGCRNIELRGLRVDGTGPETPGWVSGNYLFLRRAKHGINPWIELKGPIADAVECFQHWHATRFPRGSRFFSPWWFPGKTSSILTVSFRQALYRACEALRMPRCSPHGFRSFFVTARRGEGIPDERIAAEIGDRTVSIISQTYGDVPPNWTGAPKLSFLPSKGFPAWDRWNPSKLVFFRPTLTQKASNH